MLDSESLLGPPRHSLSTATAAAAGTATEATLNEDRDKHKIQVSDAKFSPCLSLGFMLPFVELQCCLAAYCTQGETATHNLIIKPAPALFCRDDDERIDQHQNRSSLFASDSEAPFHMQTQQHLVPLQLPGPAG